MRNVQAENLSEHSFDVGILAHALAIISNTRFGTSYNADRAAALSLFHDVPEIITGDLPTPVKYYNEELRTQYGKLETDAKNRLLDSLPSDLRDAYTSYFFEQDNELDYWKLVKAADKLSALIKCIQEIGMGNSEFRNAEQSIRKSITEMKLPAADDFVREFLPTFGLTLDEELGG